MLPSTRILPPDGFSKKFRHRKSVVLPLPEEPMMAIVSPSFSEKDISFSTAVLPKFFRTF